MVAVAATALLALPTGLAAQAADAPSDQALRLGWTSEPDTLNPLTTYSTEATEVIHLVYDTLLGYDSAIEVQPQLAASWETSSDGLSITYHLQPAATWSDGQPVTSADVKYTFETIKAEALGSYAQWLTFLDRVETPEPQTAVVVYTKPQAFDPALTIPILPAHIWSALSADDIQAFANDQPVGSGPFTFTEWRRGESLTITRNPAFWGTPPDAAAVVFVLYGNEDVAAQAIKAGDIDVLTEVPPTVWDGLVGAAGVQAVSLPSFSFHHIGVNVSDSPSSGGNPLLKDVVIRQALSYALDRQQLVTLSLAGHGTPGDALVPVGLSAWHWAPPADLMMDANPDRAKAILDEAGYTDRDGDGVRESPDGAQLRFRIIAIQSTSVDVRAAQLFRDGAAEVGIALDLTTLDENTLGSTVYDTEAPDWDLFVWGWDSGVADPSYMLGVPLCSQIGGNNDVFWCDPEYDALYDEQSTTLDPTARRAITDRMQEMFYTASP
jgi:peptide/nickel transport system substrate-binding protein